MKTLKLVLVHCSIVFALVACGGGSDVGSSSAPQESPISSLSFPLQSGLARSVANGASINVKISGYCSGTGSMVDSLPVAATFEGNTVQSVATTIKTEFTNCIPLVSSSVTTSYFDANFTPLGSISSSDYGLFLTPPTVPTSVRVGDTGTIGIETLYADSTKAIQVGRDVISFVVEPDSTNSAIINLIYKTYDSNGVLTTTEQDRYKIIADGTMTPVSSDIQYSDGSMIHLLLTVVTSPVLQDSGSWGVPEVISNDQFLVELSQITSDFVGNVFLIANPMVITNQFVLVGNPLCQTSCRLKNLKIEP